MGKSEYQLHAYLRCATVEQKKIAEHVCMGRPKRMFNVRYNVYQCWREKELLEQALNTLSA